MPMTGKLFVVSGPSGAGKGTLLARVIPELGDIALTVSATTRKPRKGERDGVQYYFLSEEKFDALISNDGLLEWATVHGAHYGTLRSEVESYRKVGKDVILEIDPQGAEQIRAEDASALLIFVAPPDLLTLKQRLIGRDSEAPDEIERRLAAACKEMAYIPEYDIVIINDDLDAAAGQLLQFMRSARHT